MLIEVNDSYLLLKKLKESKKEYLDVMNISPSFYAIVIHSLESTFIMGLSKLYDNDTEAMSIHKIINTCENFAKLFPSFHVNDYQGEDGNTTVYSEKITIDIHKDIKEMRKLIQNLEKEIYSLKGRRDKFYAHNDKKYFANIHRLVQDHPLNYNDIELLINTIGKILNKLLGDLSGEVYLTYHKNYDDIEDSLKLLKELLN